MAYFVDTNVLLYAVGFEPSDTRKKGLARDLLRESELVASIQVLQEFYTQATRPSRRLPMTHTEALQFLEGLEFVSVQQLTLQIFYSAASISNRYRLSYWDGAILAAAKAAGCDVVYSEDMSHGQDYDGVRVVNPFFDL